jgi:hypothetical protein
MEITNRATAKGENDKLFEDRLSKIFKPVNPDPSYVQKLKKTLFDKTEIYLEQDNPSIFLLLVIISLISAIIVFIIINKIINK